MKLPALGVVVVLVAGACGATVTPPGSGAASVPAASPSAGASAPVPSPTAADSTISPSAYAYVPLGPISSEVFSGSRADAMQAALDAGVNAGAPDMIAAIVTEDGSWAGAAGVAGPKGRLATPADEFAIASLSKTFTAVLILRLAELGTIDLDAPLASYLGDLQVDANGATVRQALEMRAGLADHGSDAADRIVADPARAWTAEDRVAGYKPPVAAAGSYAYSSPSYELLAIAAEHATGVSYGSALRTEILDPVGADRILDQEAGGLTPQPWALPIDEHLGRFDASDMGAGGALSCISSATFGTGAGSIASDAPSLATWLWHLFAGDIVDELSLELMLAGPHEQWAYGLEAAPYSQANAIANSGGKTGYGSQWVYFPAQRAIVVMFVNHPDFIIEPTVERLLDAALAP